MNADYKGATLKASRADADGLGLASNTRVSDINIIVPKGGI
jgi:hypothetical protein